MPPAKLIRQLCLKCLCFADSDMLFHTGRLHVPCIQITPVDSLTYLTSPLQGGPKSASRVPLSLSLSLSSVALCHVLPTRLGFDASGQATIIRLTLRSEKPVLFHVHANPNLNPCYFSESCVSAARVHVSRANIFVKMGFPTGVSSGVISARWCDTQEVSDVYNNTTR